MAERYIRFFEELGLNDVALVGGKNASLGEMYQFLSAVGIVVPNGFATTSLAYWEFLEENDLIEPITLELSNLDREHFANLPQVGKRIRSMILKGQLPDSLKAAVKTGYQQLVKNHGSEMSLAVRSSATAEDLPEASFAGQQETYLNISGYPDLLTACQKCMASLFTDRAIKYREDMNFDHMKVALSVGVQIMVRADVGCSGVIFTLDPDSGFEGVIHITGVWGLGENIVQGLVNPDEFYVFKPSLEQGKMSIIQHNLGSKQKTLQYADPPKQGMVNVDTPSEKQEQFVLGDEEIIILARWALAIEKHYGKPMDIEWAKDGCDGQLYILQARPETVFSQQKSPDVIAAYQLEQKGKVICQGAGLGGKIAAGKARILHHPQQAHKLLPGEVLVTSVTNPDWDPILRKAAAIITDQGGRTSHAAIVAREMGTAAVVGTGNGSERIRDGQLITVSCAEGNTGYVYDGKLHWKEHRIDISSLKMPGTKPMLILGDPQQAFKLSKYPVSGVGLMRLEFVINNSIRIHPMALAGFEKVTDPETRNLIQQLTHHYPDKKDYFIYKLAEHIAIIAAAFYPRDVIVRTTDFKSNEYANLIGGSYFEPPESNPMLGFRGASRYYHEKYAEGFAMECQAIKRVREDMGLTNVKVMIPFCRTLKEAEKVLSLMKGSGLERARQGLQIYMMVEIPSNVLLAEEFSAYFDGFSIGSNDLTQLTLGVDRDSDLLSPVFDVRDPAVTKMITMLLKSAQKTGTEVGLCGQAPSDYPEFAQFLVRHSIDSISFNPDALFTGIENILMAEKRITRKVGASGIST